MIRETHIPFHTDRMTLACVSIRLCFFSSISPSERSRSTPNLNAGSCNSLSADMDLVRSLQEVAPDLVELVDSGAQWQFFTHLAVHQELAVWTSVKMILSYSHISPPVHLANRCKEVYDTLEKNTTSDAWSRLVRQKPVKDAHISAAKVINQILNKLCALKQRMDADCLVRPSSFHSR